MLKPKDEINHDLNRVVKKLPRLPKRLKYYDDFEDKYRFINSINQSDTWSLQIDGHSKFIDFKVASPSMAVLVKHIAVDILSRLDPANCVDLCNNLLKNANHLALAVVVSPADFRSIWDKTIKTKSSRGYAGRLRTAIHALCNLSIGGWRPDLHTFVSQFEAPSIDLYKTVRTGECFVPADDQSKIIEYLDDVSERITRNPESVSTKEARDACILALSHQYGFRPGQISRIKTTDIRYFDSGTVHISIPLLKQRGTDRLRSITRKIKFEWGQAFIEYTKRRQIFPPQKRLHRSSLFNLSPQEMSRVIRDITKEITGTAWTSMDLRHTAAQRLVDGGASHISLSEFMGHSTTLTANVYFDASVSQAERINKALGLSPIYSKVAEIAKLKTIDRKSLAHLSLDQQIGGVPHGIPIAGIGGCQSGQSLCAKNPVLSCYTCRKFLPLSDSKIHQEVIDSLRPVVLEFADAAGPSRENPAYTQLQRMFIAAQSIIDSIESGEEP